MSPDAIFSAANLIAAASWLLLIVAGRVRHVAGTVTGAAVPLLLGLFYTVLIASHWRGAEGGFGSIDQVRALFGNDWLLMAGWVHYLAFDLFIGAWEVRDSQRCGISHLLVIPALVLTFLFGPAGLLLYYAIRFAKHGAIERNSRETDVTQPPDARASGSRTTRRSGQRAAAPLSGR
jgi:hypothetical protein